MMVARFAREMLLHEMLLREGLLASLVKYYFVNIHCKQWVSAQRANYSAKLVFSAACEANHHRSAIKIANQLTVDARTL